MGEVITTEASSRKCAAEVRESTQLRYDYSKGDFWRVCCTEPDMGRRVIDPDPFQE